MLILIAAAGALAFRLPRLDQRPMHGDEAVQAVKSGILSSEGHYCYDANEYHGPTLYYFTLPAIWLQTGGDLSRTTDATFRIIPVLFGVGLVLLLLLVGDGLGRPAAVCAAILTAISPAMVYYSRYYIQEMLLVFFTFAVIAFGWRSVRSRRIGWALLAGASLGLMHATKETCIIALGSMAVALILMVAWAKRRKGKPLRGEGSLNRIHVLAAAILAVAVSALFFSSFLANPYGPLDSIRSYVNYLTKAGNRSIHIHPWYYYLQMLLYTKYAPGPWWSEGFILALAVVGFIVAMLKKNDTGGSVWFLRFIAIYTLVMTVAYSVIPYKTPWCLTNFLQGMILLAGVGAVAIVKRVPTLPAKVIACILLAAGAWQLGGQAYRGTFRFYADQRNPYVYAHPNTDVFNLIRRVEELAEVHPKGEDILIKVIAPGSDYWPIPWYLRRFKNVGYWNEVPDDPDAPIIIASTQVEPALKEKLQDEYQVNYYGLRPKVFLLLYVRQDLWDAFLKQRQ